METKISFETENAIIYLGDRHLRVFPHEVLTIKGEGLLSVEILSACEGTISCALKLGANCEIPPSFFTRKRGGVLQLFPRTVTLPRTPEVLSQREFFLNGKAHLFTLVQDGTLRAVLETQDRYLPIVVKQSPDVSVARIGTEEVFLFNGEPSFAIGFRDDYFIALTATGTLSSDGEKLTATRSFCDVEGHVVFRDYRLQNGAFTLTSERIEKKRLAPDSLKAFAFFESVLCRDTDGIRAFCTPDTDLDALFEFLGPFCEVLCPLEDDPQGYVPLLFHESETVERVKFFQPVFKNGRVDNILEFTEL